MTIKHLYVCCSEVGWRLAKIRSFVLFLVHMSNICTGTVQQEHTIHLLVFIFLLLLKNFMSSYWNNYWKKANCSSLTIALNEQQAYSYRNSEIDNSLLMIIGNVGRLHPNVGDIDGAGEQKENGEARQEQTQGHRYGDIQLPGGGRGKEKKWEAETRWWL